MNQHPPRNIFQIHAGRPLAALPYLIGLAATWFGFANPLWHFPPLLLFYPAVLAYLARTSRSPREALKRGWLAGGLSYTACLYWVVVPVHYFGPLPWILSLPCPILLGAYLGLYPAVFVFALHLAGRRFSWFWLGLFGGLAWIILEWVRSHFLSAFPWLTLAQGFAPWTAAIQAVKFIGGLGLSGLIILPGIWIAAGSRKKSASAWLSTLALILAVLGLGIWELNKPPLQTGRTFQALIVQGNIEQNVKWSPGFQKKTVKTYLDLSRRGLQGFDPDLIIWPETAMPFYLKDESQLTALIREFCKNHGVPLLTGAPGYDPRPGGGYRLYNRAYLFNEQGEIDGFYGKEHLVPFGEYVPLPDFIPFLDKLVPGISDFSPGKRTKPLRTKKLALGILICYEIIFDNLVAERVEENSNVLVNLSNDAWFGRTSAPKQHLHQAVLRAVEQGRPVLRATNSGISAAITSRGNIRQRSGLFTTAVLQTDPIRTQSSRTFFSRQRELILAGFAVLFLILVLAGARLERKVRRSEA
ncbi:MAG: apolipoprotein N-acyltransferase [Desulfohalobiaceae bacterium]|nr:apolipoprotein N-acyltransferase [Desulfohalobiaceae bacterium]